MRGYRPSVAKPAKIVPAKIVPAAIVIGGMLALGLAGSAQAFEPDLPVIYRGVLPPGEVRAIVRSMGLNPVGGPARRGRVYVQHAIAPDGDRLRVVVDVRRGEVLSVRPMRRADADLPAGERRVAGGWRRVPVDGLDHDDLPPPLAAMVEPPPGYVRGPRTENAPPPESRPPGAGPRVIYGPSDSELKDPPPRAVAPGRRMANLPQSPAIRRPSRPAASAARPPLPRARPSQAAIAQSAGPPAREPGATPMPRAKPPDAAPPLPDRAIEE